MVRVALTGGIASGKSHVLAAFAARGIPTIDADLLARDAVAPGTPGAAAVSARFGRDVVAADGSLDRRRLADIVFGNEAARRDLEAIVHPIVYDRIAAWLSGLPAGASLAVADIPLLFETGRAGDFDCVVVAACPPDEQLRRLTVRDRLSEADARARIAAQLPLEEKIARADHVIWTTGTAEDTARQVSDVVEKVLA
jgi:dephospho-CoA kinase